MMSSKRWLYAIWLVLIGGFAALHALHLSADFPNHSEWYCDWAKYTDEGWYGNAAIRAHLFGNWYMPGDFNPAAALPVWPFLEWVLFWVTGVTVEAARGLAVAFFFANLLLSYLLLRATGTRWTALLAVTLVVTSPFLYCFSRLAILEPLMTTLTLGALNLAVRLPRLRRPVWASAWIGVLFTLMMLSKTTAIFLLPALGWALVLPLWHERSWRCVARSRRRAFRRFCLAPGWRWSRVLFAARLQIPLHCEQIRQAAGVLLAAAELVVVVSWRPVGGPHSDSGCRTGGGGSGSVLAQQAWPSTAGGPGVWRLGARGKRLHFLHDDSEPSAARYFAVVAFFAFFVVAQGAGRCSAKQRWLMRGRCWEPKHRIARFGCGGAAGR